jgi:hypothetical protein
MSNQSPFGWTAQARSAFLASLAACGTVRTAAASVNLSAQAAYKLRARDPGFARSWDAAIAIARDHLVSHLTTIAFEGWTEEVWYKGELVGERHRHNPMVAMRLLERLDRMAEKQAAPVERFDTLLRAESAGLPVSDPQVRSEVELEEQAAAAECTVRLHRARELNEHLDIVRAVAPPPLCDHDDCDACRAAEEALCLDPTADIAVSDMGGVLGCHYPDDLPEDDVWAGTIFDHRRAELHPVTAHRPSPVRASAWPIPATGQTTSPPDPADDRFSPALECQPVSTSADERPAAPSDLDAVSPAGGPGLLLDHACPLVTGHPSEKPNEKAAPPCEDAAHSVQPDGDGP